MSKITSLFLFIFAVSLILTSCKKNETYYIQYRLSGNSTHGYLVTYFNEYNSVIQDTAVLSGWTYKFTTEENY
ncbi:MAG: hypothetical protein JW731_06220, partial [Bacteroidales bacterium]|nr:hypothetical protein [Bacteroidales bacterium]